MAIASDCFFRGIAKVGAQTETALRLRLVSGTYSCENFVAENVGGVGGELARWLDSGAGRSFKAWQPAVLNDLQKQIADGIASPAKAEEVSVCLANLLVQTNAAREQSQGIVFVPTLGPFVPSSAPVCVHGSIGIGIEVGNINTVARAAAPHVERAVMNPALANTAIHVAHAVLIVATHVAAGAAHAQ